MNLPNFLIIGAAKAGTTALHECLKQHPQVFMSPVKEPNFFALEGEPMNFAAGSVQQAYLDHCIVNASDYHEQFRNISNETAIGEASPLYLYHSAAPDRILSYIPNVKIIAILRDPIERAYSNFLHHIRDELEFCTEFVQALQEEESRMLNNWWWGFHYVHAGLYYNQIKRYTDRFDSEKIKVYLYEDWVIDSTKTLQNILQFLDVEQSFVPDMSVRQNVTGIPKNRMLHSFLNQSNPVKNLFKPLLPEKFRKRLVTNFQNKNLDKPRLELEIREQLLPLFREDILRLQNLIQRDLSAWLK
jgi:hypothetical protein